MKKILLCMLAFFMWTGIAVAEGDVKGFLLAPSVMYMFSTIESSVKTEMSSRLIDLHLGYVTDSGLMLGFLYGTEAGETKVDSSSTKTDRTSYGPAIGVLSGSMHLLFTYYLSSEAKSGDYSYGNATGFQVNFGYRFAIDGNIFLVPQLAYRTITYKDTKRNGEDMGQECKVTALVPYVGVWFAF